jgi:hypothetical protein
VTRLGLSKVVAPECTQPAPDRPDPRKQSENRSDPRTMSEPGSGASSVEGTGRRSGE